MENIWKSWSWHTAFALVDSSDLDFYNGLLQSSAESSSSSGRGVAEVSDTASAAESGSSGTRADSFSSRSPNLSNALLDPRVRVFEPLWTIIPGSKAILPFLSLLSPGHPFLLRSSFSLTPELMRDGYVAKPVQGRAGMNVTLHQAESGAVIDATGGKFSSRGPEGATDDVNVYQELCLLPKRGDFYFQACTFAVNGHFGGICLRDGRTPILGYLSDVTALRVVPDPAAAEAPSEDAASAPLTPPSVGSHEDALAAALSAGKPGFAATTRNLLRGVSCCEPAVLCAVDHVSSMSRVHSSATLTVF